MKKFVVAAIFLALSFSAHSQFGISSPLYTGKDAKIFKMRWGTELNLFIPLHRNIDLGKNLKLHITFHPGITWSWYDFRSDLIVERQNNFTSFVADSDGTHLYHHGFLRTSSLMHTSAAGMPVKFNLRLKKYHLTFAPGFFVEYLTGGKFKRKFSENGSSKKVISKFSDDFGYYGFNRFQYGVSMSISYRFLTVYGTYYLANLFKSNEGIDVRRYDIGISFSFLLPKKMRENS